jgi:glycosyltransferase involved in cell wall biosynthesis
MRTILFVYPEPHFISAGGISTYLQHAIRAHLEAGNDVHLLTWLTPFQDKYDLQITDELVAPLDRSRVTVLRFSRAEIERVSDAALLNKNISDLLAPEIIRLERALAPDVIEGTDHCYPLHSYLQLRMCGAHASNVPTITFCHGLMQDTYPASALKPSPLAMLEMVHERQVLQWSDHVFAPSEAAAANIAATIPGTRERIKLVREPYFSHRWDLKPELEGSRFIYFGRVSFAKGVDLIASMLSAIRDAWPISAVTLMGRLVRTPFELNDWRDYFRATLPHALHDKLRFLAPVDRSAVGEIVSSYSFFPNFSRSEAFSYSTLEAISRGVVPLVIGSSPMAEFLPRDLREKATFNKCPDETAEIVGVLSYWRDNYRAAMAATQQHVEALTSPPAYTAAYDTLEPLHAQVGEPAYEGSDVTILIATRNDAQALQDAVVSVERQTRKIREVVVADTGTTDEQSLAILSALVRSGRVRLLTAPGIALAGARTLLAEAAETDLINFLDPSEVLAETYVEKALRALNSNPDRISAVATRRRTSTGDVQGASCFVLDTPLHWLCNELTMTALIKKQLLERLHFDSDGPSEDAEAWSWWLRFIILGHHAVLVPETLCWQRSREASTALSRSAREALALAPLKRLAQEAAERSTSAPPLDWIIALSGQVLAEGSLLKTALAQEKRLNRRVLVRGQMVSVIGEKNFVHAVRLGRRLAAGRKFVGASSALHRAAEKFRLLAPTHK